MKTLVTTAALTLLLAAGAAQAQTAAPAAPTPTASAPVAGVSIADLTAWLAKEGAVAEAPQMEGQRRYMRVTADGLPWILYLQSCVEDVCSDLQFSAGLINSQISAEKVNGWNRDRRFVKAIYEPAPSEGAGAGAGAGALAQYDVLVPTGGPDQMADNLAIWRSLLPEFVRLMSSGRATASQLPSVGPSAPPPGGR